VPKFNIFTVKLTFTFSGGFGQRNWTWSHRLWHALAASNKTYSNLQIYPKSLCNTIVTRSYQYRKARFDPWVSKSTIL